MYKAIKNNKMSALNVVMLSILIINKKQQIITTSIRTQINIY